MIKRNKKYMILPWDYHNRKQYFLVEYSTVIIGDDSIRPLGVKVIAKKGEHLVDIAFNYATNEHVWRFNVDDRPGQWIELKLTKKYFEECKLEVEDESSAKLLFELEY